MIVFEVQTSLVGRQSFHHVWRMLSLRSFLPGAVETITKMLTVFLGKLTRDTFSFLNTLWLSMYLLIPISTGESPWVGRDFILFIMDLSSTWDIPKNPIIDKQNNTNAFIRNRLGSIYTVTSVELTLRKKWNNYFFTQQMLISETKFDPIWPCSV